MWKTREAYIYNLSILLLSLFNSCELINSGEAVPSYLKIDRFNVSLPLNDYELYGSKSSKITDAWVYIDDNLLGAFELPFTIPILEKGVTNILIRPGIKKNGISADRFIYPYYTTFEQTINFKPDSSFSITPNIEYKKDITIWKSDFDGIGISFYPKTKQSGNINLIMDSLLIFHESNEKNKASAKMEFSDSTGKFEILSLPIELTKMTAPFFLELNYSINYPLAIGVYQDEPSEGKKYYKMVLKENRIIENIDVWNKIYIDLTEYIIGSKTSKFSLFFESNRKDNVKEEQIFIDNVKILGRRI